MARLFCALSLVVLVLACSEEPAGSEDTGADARDGVAVDAEGVDAEPIDASPSDARVADAGDAASADDAGSADAGSADAGSADTGSADAGSADAGSADAETGDSASEVDDAGSADAGSADAETGDSASPDAEVDDAGSADAGSADPGSADASPSDASPSDASPSDASPSDASPSDADPSDAAPSDASSSDAGAPDAGADAGPRECGTAFGVERVSVNAMGVEGNGRSYGGSLSGDARYVAFESAAGNLVPNGATSFGHVFLRDRALGTIIRVSETPAGLEGNGFSGVPAISRDGRFIAFTSGANNLTGSFVNQVVVYDAQTGTNEVASVNGAGTVANAMSGHSRISDDGRFVVFPSFASNLVAGDGNGVRDVFVRDRQTQTTERVSVSSAGVESDLPAGPATISGDGRYVAFTSAATNLVAGDSNGTNDVFLRDRQLGTTTRVSVNGAAQIGGQYPAISDDGRFVAFETPAGQIYLWDATSSTVELISVNTSGGPGTGASSYATVSDDGRFVAFQSLAANLIANDTNGTMDVFVRDRLTATTRRLSIAAAEPDNFSLSPALSGDGRATVFESLATNLVPGDTNTYNDVFVVATDPTCP